MVTPNFYESARAYLAAHGENASYDSWRDTYNIITILTSGVAMQTAWNDAWFDLFY